VVSRPTDPDPPSEPVPSELSLSEPAPVPVLFTWLRVEGLVDAAGVFDPTERALLQVDVAGYLGLLRTRGAKVTGALVSLAMLSERDPGTGARVVVGSTSRLAQLLSGDGEPWGKKAAAAVLTQLRQAGLVAYVPSVGLGRGRGGTSPRWVLHEGLFAVVETLQTPAGTTSDGVASAGAPYSGSALVGVVGQGPGQGGQVPAGVGHRRGGLCGPTPPAGIGAGEKGGPGKGQPLRGGQHEMDGMKSSHLHDAQSPTAAPAVAAAPAQVRSAPALPSPASSTLPSPALPAPADRSRPQVDYVVRARLVGALAELGWERPHQVVDAVDPALVAGWLQQVRTRAQAGRPLRSPGGFLRTQLLNPAGPVPPPGFVPGTTVAVREGQLVLIPPTGAGGTSEAPASRQLSTADIMAALGDAAAQGLDLRGQVAAAVRARTGPGTDAATRSAIYRQVAVDLLTGAGLAPSGPHSPEHSPDPSPEHGPDLLPTTQERP
jgi:hypothetical protein